MDNLTNKQGKFIFILELIFRILVLAPHSFQPRSSLNIIFTQSSIQSGSGNAEFFGGFGNITAVFFDHM